MSVILDKLSQLVAQSSISPEDQNDLLLFLPVIPEEALQELLEVFQKDPKRLESFEENFKAKVNILINGRDRWDKLIAAEEEMLQHEADLYEDKDKNNF
ncbi:MAG: hypothetical protein PHV78_01295 [Patescibacteria group bacterium]|nr:hypothetical protein [Patescibacteria group bacterium]MDD5121208.1 hypothetical protein [Patescibacteria group bacterium]MDD5221763.1 hypothetical protein [Patescibacteria group bacterium]MDD5395873.1 hypothetical protein [Patescibacteria group bacterium]